VYTLVCPPKPPSEDDYNDNLYNNVSKRQRRRPFSPLSVLSGSPHLLLNKVVPTIRKWRDNTAQIVQLKQFQTMLARSLSKRVGRNNNKVNGGPNNNEWKSKGNNKNKRSAHSVYMYIYICICTHFSYIHTHTQRERERQTHTLLCSLHCTTITTIHTHTHTHVHTHTYTHTHTNKHTHTRTHTHTYTHTHTHTKAYAQRDSYCCEAVSCE